MSMDCSKMSVKGHTHANYSGECSLDYADTWLGDIFDLDRGLYWRTYQPQTLESAVTTTPSSKFSNDHYDK